MRSTTQYQIEHCTDSDKLYKLIQAHSRNCIRKLARVVARRRANAGGNYEEEYRAICARHKITIR